MAAATQQSVSSSMFVQFLRPNPFRIPIDVAQRRPFSLIRLHQKGSRNTEDLRNQGVKSCGMCQSPADIWKKKSEKTRKIDSFFFFFVFDFEGQNSHGNIDLLNRGSHFFKVETRIFFSIYISSFSGKMHTTDETPIRILH